MVQWKRVGEAVAQKVGWRIIVRKRYQFPDGTEHDFDVIGPEGEESATMLALTSDNRVIISEQYRAGPDRSMNELPGGIVDKGEDPEQAVTRELLEETGYKAKKVSYLGAVYPEAYLHMKSHYFIGYDCEKVAEPAYESTEYIEVKTITIDEFMESARGGGTTHVAAAFLAYDILMKLKKKRG